MKALLAVITALAVLSFLYFVVVALASFGHARAEVKPFPPSKSSWLPAVLARDSYTDRGKELLARYHRAFFFAMISGLIMAMSGSAYVHLRDDVPGPWLSKSPAFVAVPAVRHATALMAFLGCVLWLIVALLAAARRKLRGEPTSDVQRNGMLKSVQWTFGSFAVAALSLMLLRNI